VTSTAKTPAEYLETLPPDRREAVARLRQVVADNLPDGFSEAMGYGMLGYGVPHSIYPAGYHCDPKQPLPFIGIASQKNFIALYHLGVYAMPHLLDWFVQEFNARSKAKLDMGKSCIRFKKPEHIPFDLIGELASKVTVDEWIACYEENFKSQKR
jgi:uncharacterized protein YdhG (YjbR/CyaY superfamily)